MAKEGALAALAESRPGVKSKERDFELEAARADAARLARRSKRWRSSSCWWRERALGLSGRVPRRVDAATKAELLDLIDAATAEGWTFRGACRELELGEVRAYRWAERRATASSPTAVPVAEIVTLYHEWGEVDRSQRKLAHRGSYLGWVWVSPSSVRRVLAAQACTCDQCPAPVARCASRSRSGSSTDPTRSGSTDTTHFPRAKAAVIAIEDLMSRKWIAEIVSSEETSTQVQLVFTDALAAEGLLALVEARQDGLVIPAVDDERRPVLLAMSDNGPQMTSGSTRELMALCAIHQHFGRPGTPTDQAWIESLFGHVKIENPHLLAIRDAAVLREELAIVRTRYNSRRLHAGIGYVTPNDERSARPAKPDSKPLASAGLPTIASNVHPNTNGDPAMLTDSRRISIDNSETGQD